MSYNTDAKKLIRYIAKGAAFYKIMSDPDLVTEVAQAIMMADHNYIAGTGATKKTVRFNYARNCILGMIKKFNSPVIQTLPTTTKDGERKVIDVQEDGSENYFVDYNDNPLTISKSILDDREYQIIEMYFYEDRTMEQIGEQLTITRQRVFQLFNRALEKLRAHGDKFEQ